ncbi:MAG: hydrogenase maturation nickel metallochaperone HypA [Coriobacteriia bacterium]|nr:hydrogenase maturation nickel metallochaperone HypA [Coriobacteriia bacterium]MBS5477278.1 hydrogenase maturation nickel metallochaperone HypA [Coriobacteriia bacterium]
MHEYSIVAGVMDTIIPLARKAGATHIACVRLRIGVMTEVVKESLDFMWDIVCDERGDMTRGAKLEVEFVQPRSSCMVCGEEFDHDQLHVRCPKCGSASTLLLQGRELDIASFDVDTPDASDEEPSPSPDGGGTAPSN